MDTFTAFLVACLSIWVTWFLFLRRNGRGNQLPPGPYPLPIIGNIHQLGKQSHKNLSQLSKTYGPLMSLQLGGRYAIVISSREVAKEILQKHDLTFSGRIIPDSAEAYGHHKHSMLFLPVGKQWRTLRKLSKEQMFTTHRLKATQQLRQQKLDKLCEYVAKCCQSGRVVNLRDASFVTTLNLMSATLFSTQVSDYESNGTGLEFREIFEGLTSVLGEPNIADFFPFLRRIDPQGVRKKSNFYFGKLFGFMADVIDQRLRSRLSTSSTSPRKTDFLEMLIDVSKGSEYEMSMDVIKVLLGDFFGGGSDTTSNAAEWAMKELLVHPEKLSKAKEELKSVIGEKQIQESDISKLPYLQALVKETFRLHPPAPLLIPRVTEDEVQLCGYTIPKGTQTVVNAWAVGRDPSVWSNPDAFEPERFLGLKIEFKGQDMELIPFGFGRRMCPGSALASIMLHMMLANLIHKFDWKLQLEGAEAETEADLVGEVLGLSLRSPLPLKAIPIKPTN